MSVSTKVNIEYHTPRFHRRIFANLIDFLLFLLVAVGGFLGVRAIVQVTPGYSENISSLLSIRKDSGLYHLDEEGSSTDIISYLSGSDLNAYAKCQNAEGAVDTFIAYLGENVSLEDALTVQEDYDRFRLNISSGDTHYFVKDSSGDIVYNTREDGTLYLGYAEYFSSVYTPYIDEHALGYLVTLVPEYLDLVKWEATILFAVEIPIGILLGGILVYLVPPLILKRGKRTLGKALYQIGLADSRLLSCSWKRYLARWFIFFFGEIVLSIFTFGIPCIISFSLMAFSKHKQGFPDYILGLYEIDCSEQRLYLSYEEITLSGYDGEKKPVDFRNRYED